MKRAIWGVGLAVFLANPNYAAAENYEDAAGDWMIKREVSALDDSKSVYLFLDATEPISGGGREPATLILRCVENETDAFISWGAFLGSDDPVSVTTRIDKAPASTASWVGSTSNNTTFAPNPINFIKSILTAQTLFVRVDTYSDGKVDGLFRLAGLDQIVLELAEACHWKL